MSAGYDDTPQLEESFSNGDISEAIHAALCELLDKGQIQMVGRTASGDAVFAATNPGPVTKRIRYRLQFTLLFPALIVEYIAGHTAITLAKLFKEPLQLVLWLANIADWLYQWRRRFSNRGDPFTTWLSIKPFECP